MIHHFLFSYRCSLFWCKHKELCYWVNISHNFPW